MGRFFSNEEMEALLANGAQTAADGANDPAPVGMLTLPDMGWRWLITEVDPQDPDVAYGLCDLLTGCPECGCVRLSELEELRGPAGMLVERSKGYRPSPDLPLSRLDRMASEAGRIVV